MAVNFEVKGMLARLLATEDIMVEHKKVSTACFNVQTRVLTLPMWEKASNNVYDLLLSHEAAHALYTPNEDWNKNHKIPIQFVNVVEDARIEKLMKRRYAGLSKTFYTGYKELADDDFFELGDDDISTYNLADRANLYFKIGSHLNLSFTPEEKEIIDLINDCETFDDVLEAAEILFKYCNEKSEGFESLDIPVSIQITSSNSLEGYPIEMGEMPSTESKDSDEGKSDANDSNGSKSTPQTSGPGSTPIDNSDEQKSNDSNSSSNGNLKDSNNTTRNKQGSTTGDQSSTVKTVESLEKAIKDLVENDTIENIYIETPDLDLSEIIVSNSDIHRRCKEHWQNYEDQVFSEVDKKYTEFKRSAQKEVNYLVKEFEAHKAADSYIRATTSRTGVLDCTKLHTYKFNDDLFKKITTLPDGKNHGLIFILDWSGSMDEIIYDTIKQLFNLIWFCKKVSIPFEVYAFTTDYPYIKYNENGSVYSRKPSYTKKHGILQVAEWFSLMNLLTSKVNTSNLDTQMKCIFRMAYSINRNHSTIYRIPPGIGLSGTPLNESLIALQQIIPNFQKENGVQKVQCVILTDGDACPIKYHYENRSWKNPSETNMGLGHITNTTVLRNRKTGNTYTFMSDWWEHTNIFIRNLRDMFPDTNFIGIRLIDSRDAHMFIRRYASSSKEYDKILAYWRKNKSCSIKTSVGYHSYFGISSNTLSQDIEFDVAESASKAQIKNAFIKSLKTKKMNKKILGEFIELIV